VGTYVRIVPRNRYDWVAIRRFYDAGHTARQCIEGFGISNGAWHHAVQRGVIVVRDPAPRRPRGTTRQAVERLLGAGLTQVEIARALGVSKPTVCFHIRKLGIPAQSALSRRFDWVEIRAHYEAGHSLRDCLRTFGFSRAAWADAVKRGAIVPRPRLEPLEDILPAGRRRSRFHVKGRLLLAGLKEPKCESCGVADWCGQSLSLELHHVNGDGQDNRLENLRLLCPNCHSQTDTWGARNKGRSR
jgi:5-methylcytosine-specific restriction endonuclease McrA